MKNKLSQGNRILLMMIAIGLTCLVGIALAYNGIVSPNNANENGDDQAAWVETIHDRMMTYTEDFTYEDYLETAWTQGVNYE